MQELLKAIEELKRAYKDSGVDMVTVEINLDKTRIRIDGENFEMPKQKPLTNGEWLRGLSDEELSKAILERSNKITARAIIDEIGNAWKHGWLCDRYMQDIRAHYGVDKNEWTED